MNRRHFLQTMIGGVAASAAVRTFPFRVYSFPSDIVEPSAATLAYVDAVMMEAINSLRADVLADNFFLENAWLVRLRSREPLAIESKLTRSPLLTSDWLA